MSHEDGIKHLICKLAGYLVASITKSEREWQEWSRPFLQTAFAAQFGKEVGAQYFERFDSNFSPMVGKGKFLWVDSLPEDNDYVSVGSVEPRLQEEYSSFSEDLIKSELETFLKAFVEFLLQEENYDARIRVVARKLCGMLKVSAYEYSEMEKVYFQKKTARDSNFAADFHTIASTIPKTSLLVPYRMWKVGFVAVGGGAMVGMAGALSAPTIASAIIPLLTTATTFTQISITVETFMAYGGVLTSSIIPSLCTMYGTLITGNRMLARTQPMSNAFALLPLHVATNDDGAKGSQFAMREGANNVAGGPVYILVPGHMEKNVSLRALWGANGSILLENDNDATTSTSSLVEEGAGYSYRENVSLDSLPGASVSQKRETELETGIMVHSADGSSSVESPQPHHSIVHDVIAHELHVFKGKVVQRIRQEIVQDMAPILPTVIQHEVEAYTTAIADSVTHMESDEIAEKEWEIVKQRYYGWWRELVALGEEYVLQWEPALLTELNDSFYDMFISQVKSTIESKVKDAIMSYVASSVYPLKKALGLPRLVLSKIKELDGSWVRAMDKAYQAGHLLARTLYKQRIEAHLKRESWRPVTLVGYGMGARLIFHCLEHLYDISQRNTRAMASLTAEGITDAGLDVKGIVEHAVLIGAPVSTALHGWQKARLVVSGRLVNCYARFDWILALLYRTKSYELGVAGLYPVHLFPEAKGAETGSEERIRQDPALARVFETVDDSITLCDDLGDHASELPSTERSFSGDEADKVAVELDFTGVGFAELQDVENIDLTKLIPSHSDYPKMLYQILDLVKL